MRLRPRRARTLVAAAAVLLPARARRWVHTSVLGHRIAPTARLGRSFVDVDELVMEPGAFINSLTVIRGCEHVHIGADASVGPLNWVNAVRRDKGYFDDQPDRWPALILRRGAMIGTRHMIDNCDLVEIGEYAALAGFGSQILTHSVDLVRVKQVAKPTRIGDHSVVATRTVLLSGATVPPRTVVSAGSVVKGTLRESETLYDGVPAVAVRALKPEMGYFHRTVANIR